jgi:hypothetical protein
MACRAAGRAWLPEAMRRNAALLCHRSNLTLAGQRPPQEGRREGKKLALVGNGGQVVTEIVGL